MLIQVSLVYNSQEYLTSEEIKLFQSLLNGLFSLLREQKCQEPVSDLLSVPNRIIPTLEYVNT